MNPLTAGILGGALGVLIGAVAVLLVNLRARQQRGSPLSPPLEQPPPPLPQGVADVLAVLRSGGIVLDSSDAVVKASSTALAHGLVREHELVHAELLAMARAVRRDGQIREAEMDLARGPLGAGTLHVGARVAPIGSDFVLLLVEDHTQQRRLEAVRRDFVVNVSHELKTPVGGLALLAEAVLDANDDPEAVARFATRMTTETGRLTRLVSEIVDLSRLQVADALADPVPVDVGECARAAVDESRLVAQERQVELTAAAGPGELQVYGDRDLLTTAVRNLVTNAISYSDNGTRVAVGVGRDDGVVEVTVTDQGQGIPREEQERIFERFYRIDAARSRATGSTGLGLAIVKHVCATHGGDVTVWSEEGRGSTFTMRLPAASDRGIPAAEDPAPRGAHPPREVRS